MKEIPLSKGLVALVDDEDYEYLNQWKWHARLSSNTYYAERKDGSFPRAKYSMHRVLLGLKPGDGIVGDHRDNNGLNNQKSNLRRCTVGQNSENRGDRRGKSQYLGVVFHRNGWQAQIRYQNKKIYIGWFKSEIEAAKARDRKAIELHKEFANLNFPI